VARRSGPGHTPERTAVATLEADAVRDVIRGEELGAITVPGPGRSCRPLLGPGAIDEVENRLPALDPREDPFQIGPFKTLLPHQFLDQPRRDRIVYVIAGAGGEPPGGAMPEHSPGGRNDDLSGTSG